jgi:hypothetical protein
MTANLMKFSVLLFSLPISSLKYLSIFGLIYIAIFREKMNRLILRRPRSLMPMLILANATFLSLIFLHFYLMISQVQKEIDSLRDGPPVVGNFVDGRINMKIVICAKAF